MNDFMKRIQRLKKKLNIVTPLAVTLVYMDGTERTMNDDLAFDELCTRGDISAVRCSAEDLRSLLEAMLPAVTASLIGKMILQCWRMTMNIKELERRINKIRPQRLVVIGMLPDGTQRKMTAPELVETGSELVRVIAGNDLSDLDLILGTLKKAIE